MVLVLTGVAVVMGGILAYVNHLTEGPIAQQKEKALADGIKAVMVCDDLVVTQTDTVLRNDAKGKELTYIIYNVKNAQGNDLGAAVESTTGGFGGNLKVLVGFNPEGTILGYTLLEHAETPGLGAKADKWFQKGGKVTSSASRLLNLSPFPRMAARWMPLPPRPSPVVHS